MTIYRYGLLLGVSLFATAAMAQEKTANGQATCLAAAGSTAPAPGCAPAADSAATASDGIAEIVVTAQRRSENMQRVPISVAAVTGEQLAANGILNLASIANVVPGVVVQRTFAGTTPFLRGVGTTQTGFTSEVPVATYIDGIYLPNAASSIFAFNNIARIEVLKGPQGTLFGRNAVGGLINVVTRDPTEAVHAEGSIGYSNYHTVDANLYATGGLAPDLAADVAVLYHHQGEGWGTNLADGTDILKNRDVSVASKVKWTPGSKTTVTLRGFYDRSRGDLGSVWGVYPGSVGSDGTPFFGKFDVYNRLKPFNNSEQANGGLRIEQELGFANLISLTGYNYIHSDALGEANGIAGNLVPGQGVINLHNNGRSRTFTQEVQLQSAKGAGWLQWIVGVFYMHDKLNLRSDVLPTCIGAACNTVATPVRSYGIQTLDSYAAFGEVTAEVLTGTKITLGLRYTSDHKDLSEAHREPLGGYPTSVASLASPNFWGDTRSAAGPKATFSKLTWRGVLTHEFDANSMIYASANRGFKAGAYNPTSFTNPVIGPEVLDAYEIGTKNQFFDRRVRFNASAFYYNYKGIQLRTTAPPAPAGQSILYNAASAHFKGVEAELIVAPVRHLTLSASAAYLDAKFESFPGGTCTSARAIGGAVLGGAASAPCVLDGYRVPRAPKLTSNFAIAYTIPTAAGDFTLNASDAYNSGFYWEVDNRLRQKSYHQVNAALTWDSPSKRIYVQAYARNINKPSYFWGVSEASQGTDAFTPGEPRTYGLKLGFKY